MSKKFRVLAGTHVNKYGIFKTGSVAEDDKDLHKLEPLRFRLINPGEEEQAKDDESANRRETYNEMTVAQLQKLAEDEELDLEGATKKADIIEKLVAAGL